MPQLAVIADDLTGAADTGACFAGAGLATVIPFSDSPVLAADVVVLSTETRDLDAGDAAAIVADVTARCVANQRAAPRWLYKKIDSALRGHPRDELRATMTAAGATRALVAPAFPAEGRTTVGGRQLIDGAPLEASRFGGAGATSDLVALLRSDDAMPIVRLDLAAVRGPAAASRQMLDDGAPGILVADAETEADLLALARAASDSRLRVLCGTAGFARHLAVTLPFAGSLPPVTIPTRRTGPPLVVAGSQHEATRRQVEAARRAGVPIVCPALNMYEDEISAHDAAAEVATSLAAGRATIVTTAGLPPSPLGGRVVAARLAQMVATPAVRRHIGGLVLTGGDVAAAVCHALDATAIRLGGEIVAGQPWGLLEGGMLAGAAVATKAGSFGDERALLACIAFLTT